VCAVAIALAGCGGDSDRDRVGDYIESLNAAQEEAGPLLEQANDVYSRFAKGTLKGPQAEVEMRRSRTLIDAVRGKVEAIPAPPEARTLRTLVIKVYEANDGMAEQTRLMAAYVPAQRTALRRFRALGTRLQRDLRAAHSDAGKQARALRRYAAGLVSVTASLRKLRPPLIMAPARNSGLERLQESREIALGLRSAVLAKDQAKVLKLLDRFQEVNAREADEKARKAAYQAYQEYAVDIRRAEARVAREVSRLNGSLDG
jgi:hypothetical protein